MKTIFNVAEDIVWINLHEVMLRIISLCEIFLYLVRKCLYLISNKQ